MMQTLSRIELDWIISAIDAQAHELAQFMYNSDSDPETVEFQLAKLRREGLKNVSRKLRIVKEENAKRIKIE